MKHTNRDGPKYKGIYKNIKKIMQDKINTQMLKKYIY